MEIFKEELRNYRKQCMAKSVVIPQGLKGRGGEQGGHQAPLAEEYWLLQEWLDPWQNVSGERRNVHA